MSEELIWYVQALSPLNGVMAEFYSEQVNDDDLYRAAMGCRLDKRGLVFPNERIRVCDTAPVEKTPFKGTVTEVWIVAGSIRCDRNGSVREPEDEPGTLRWSEGGHLTLDTDKG